MPRQLDMNLYTPHTTHHPTQPQRRSKRKSSSGNSIGIADDDFLLGGGRNGEANSDDDLAAVNASITKGGMGKSMGKSKGKGKRTVQQREVGQASEVEEQPPKRYCVVRNMHPNAVKYFEGRYEVRLFVVQTTRRPLTLHDFSLHRR